MEILGKNSFEDLVAKYSSLHFMKRLAHLGADGSPEPEVMNRPSQQFVLSVSNHMSAVRSAIAESRSFIQHAEIPPPESWLTGNEKGAGSMPLR